MAEPINVTQSIISALERVNDYCISSFKELEYKKLALDINKDRHINVSEVIEIQDEYQAEQFENLCKVIKEILNNKVEKVIASNTLRTSPCILVTNRCGWSKERKLRMMKEEAEDTSSLPFKKIFEINPFNPIIIGLKKMVDLDQTNSNISDLKDLVELLYESSLLASGYSLNCPKEHTERIYRLVDFKLNNKKYSSEAGALTSDKIAEDTPLAGEASDSSIEAVD